MTSTSTVSTSGSTTYVSATASGLDTNSLVEAAVAQKTARADTIDARITADQTKITAYQSLQSLMEALSDSLEGLAAPTYSVLDEGNTFDAKQVSLSGSNGIDASSVLAVSVDSDAVTSSYEIEVKQLAKAMKVAGDSFASDEALGLEGSFSIGVSDKVTTISVTADMTLRDVSEAISNTSGESGVTATMIRTGDGVYRLVISGKDTTQEIEISALSGDDVLAGLGVTDEDGVFQNVLQQAQSAIIVVDGAEITLDSNEVDDVIPGVSMSLLGSSEGETVTLSVEPNYDGVKTAITDFIDAYNALREFIASQQSVGSDGTVADDAVLFGDTVLRTFNSAVSAMLAQSIGDGDISSLSAMGITFTSDNQLELSDETALDNAILSNIDEIESFFETSYSASDFGLKLLRNDTTQSLAFTLSIVADVDGNITQVLADGESAMFTVSGDRIIGVDGTAYEGLTFVLTDAKTEDVTVTLTQGFANLVANLATSYGASSGVVQSAIDQINSTDETLQARSDKIRENAEVYRQTLIDKYAVMETEVQAAKLLQQQLEALLDGLSSDD